MITVGLDEAQSNLDKLLDKVYSGEQVTITKSGVPCARIVAIPKPPEKGMTPHEAALAIREFRKGRSLQGIEVEDLIELGRR